VTAHHDFFGISVLECAAVGLDLVAPNALAYPEHFGENRLHARSGLLDAFLVSLSSASRRKWIDAAGRYGWPNVAQRAWVMLNQVWGKPDDAEREAVHRN